MGLFTEILSKKIKKIKEKKSWGRGGGGEADVTRVFVPLIRVMYVTIPPEMSSLLLLHFLATATFPKGVPCIDFGFSSDGISFSFFLHQKNALVTHTHKVYKCH